MQTKFLSRSAWPVLGVALVLGIAQVSVVAQQPTAKSGASNAAPVLKFQANTAALTTGEYWTADRMAAAKPLPLPRSAPGSVDLDPQVINRLAISKSESMKTGPGGLPTLRGLSTQAVPTERFPLSTGDSLDNDSLDNESLSPESTPFSYAFPFNNFRTGINNQYPYTTVGKLFFTIPAGASEPAGDYVCSGSVTLNSHTVLTARHCMFDIATGKWYGNWTFYPGWNNGSNAALGGGWKVNFAYTWVSNAPNWYWDIGFLSMHDSTGKGCGGDSGKVIGAYTGWLGYAYGGDYTQRQWNIFGYPQGKPFEGNYLYQDNGATGQVNPLGTSGIVEIGNPQTGGTSGGPWILGFNPGNATDPSPSNNTFPTYFNLANGVNSFQWTSPAEPLAINGPEFNGDNFWNLYVAYSKILCR
jgi:V8-like Glu-specific endopeptidase